MAEVRIPVSVEKRDKLRTAATQLRDIVSSIEDVAHWLESDARDGSIDLEMLRNINTTLTRLAPKLVQAGTDIRTMTRSFQ